MLFRLTIYQVRVQNAPTHHMIVHSRRMETLADDGGELNARSNAAKIDGIHDSFLYCIRQHMKALK